MARPKRHPSKARSTEALQDAKAGNRELRRLTGTFDAQWQDWIRNSAAPEFECLPLTEMVYALSDLHARAQEMRLDFLGYLLGMALQEALIQLRAVEPPSYPSPPAR